MTQALFTSMTGLNAGVEQLTVVSDNVANMNTTAYKTSRVDFQDVWYRTKTTGTNSTAVLGGTNHYKIGVGVQCASITKDFAAASTNTTGRTTDLAITGPGWFCVQNADGQTLLTRDGTFSLDELGYLCTASGSKVLGMDSITSSTGSTTPIKVPTMIKVEEEPTPKSKFGDMKLGELNCCETITSGKFGIKNEEDGLTYVFELEGVDKDTKVSDLVDKLNGLTGTATKVTVDPNTGEEQTEEVEKGIGDLVTFEYKAGVIEATDNSADGIAFKTVGGGSNFLSQTNLLSVTPEDGVYTSTVMNMSATISEIDDITADETQLYKSLSFGKDGLLTVTYGDGSVLTVQATEDGASTYFSYTDAGGIIINDDINNSGKASLYVDPNLLTKANMQLQIAKVTNDSGLVAVGNNCYEFGVDSGKVVYTAAGINGTGAVASGALEASNVDLAQQFSYMILAQRLVQANSQVFNNANSMLETLVYLGR